MSAVSNITLKRQLPFFCCMATTVVIVEFLSIFMLSLPNGVIIAAYLHLMIIGILSIWVYYSHGQHDIKLGLLLLVMTAATGPFGAGICLLTVIVYASQSINVTISPSEWIKDFFAYDATQESDLIHDRIAFGLDTISYNNIEPFQDILIGGTVLQKQMAIAKITQHFHPRFASLLLLAVQDPNAAVRVQAATGLAKIEHDFMEKFMHTNKAFEGVENDNLSCLQMANLCDDYAHAGVLDEDSSCNFRAKAIEIYEAYLSRCYDPDRQVLLARLYLRQEQPEKTCQLLGEAIESGDTTQGAVLWYLEALFRLKKLVQLRKVVKQYAYLLKNFDMYKSLEESKDAIGIWVSTDEATYAT